VCDNAGRALDLLRTENFDLILSDVVMPGKSGLELLEDLKKNGVKTPIVLISGQANIEMAVRATKLGALDFLEKPLSTDKLLVTVDNALRLSRLEDENRELWQRLGKHELIGSGAAMARLLAQIERVAAFTNLIGAFFGSAVATTSSVSGRGISTRPSTRMGSDQNSRSPST